MELAPLTVARLVATARHARAQAYAPYSGFPVGAAVLAHDGRMFSGCNVENASFGLSLCAERNSVAATVAAGARPLAVAVVGGPLLTPPCGACRQFLAEFGLDMAVVMATPDDERQEIVTLADLLPRAFLSDQF
jgi:cytidine deaminase